MNMLVNYTMRHTGIHQENTIISFQREIKWCRKKLNFRLSMSRVIVRLDFYNFGLVSGRALYKKGIDIYET